VVETSRSFALMLAHVGHEKRRGKKKKGDKSLRTLVLLDPTLRKRGMENVRGKGEGEGRKGRERGKGLRLLRLLSPSSSFLSCCPASGHAMTKITRRREKGKRKEKGGKHRQASPENPCALLPSEFEPASLPFLTAIRRSPEKMFKPVGGYRWEGKGRREGGGGREEKKKRAVCVYLFAVTLNHDRWCLLTWSGFHPARPMSDDCSEKRRRQKRREKGEGGRGKKKKRGEGDCTCPTIH